MFTEDVRHSLMEVFCNRFVGIDIDIAEPMEWAQVIQSTNMVVVDMGEEHAIEFAEGHVEHLLSEIRSAVDEHSGGVGLDEC